MNKRILFSPVGGTDPISMKNWKDGSILHVCRVYQPDEIYLYMSKEIIELHEKDNRYLYCLDKLYEFLGKEYSVHLIKNEELVNVQDFDVFYEDFRNELSAILSSMDDSDELFINVSSGTPAMKSALIVIKTLGEVSCRMIQVVTPSRSMNEHQHIGYDVELLWEGNEDNVEEFENRCMEIMCPSLSQLRNEEIIKKLVRSYNYSAALEVIETMPSNITHNYKPLVELANKRLILDVNTVLRLCKENNVDFLPVKDEKYRTFFEYTLALDIKLKNELYGDFVRGLTPVVLSLYEYLIKSKLGIDINDYCFSFKMQNGNRGRKWDEAKLNSDPISQNWISIWRRKYGQNLRYEYVKSDNLIDIMIDGFIQKPELNEVLSLSTELRRIEEGIRNVAAHEVTAVTPKRIKEFTGFEPNEIMIIIKKLVHNTEIKVSKSSWNSYDDMNEYIISKINS